MKKLWKNAKTRKIIAYLFFAYAIYKILWIVLGSGLVLAAKASGAYKLGEITGYYLGPVIFAFIGWLFFRSGKKLHEAAGDSLATN